jgi:alginate O-acetyltransferase complex protein AlgI
LLFNSYVFIFAFLPLTLTGFYLAGNINPRLAACWLALASIGFYAWWNPSFLALLLGSIAFNYTIGHVIARHESRPRWQGWLLAFGVAGNIGLLVWFKYLYALLGFLRERGVVDIPFAETILPLGISFFTFTQIGYLVDVKQGVARDRGLLSCILLVTFFPHLIAGPILHNREMMPQFADPRVYRFSGENACVGATIFVIGLLKKCLLADPLAGFVQAGFGQPQNLGLLATWYAVLCYSFQLYFDFSGYSDMAIGSRAYSTCAFRSTSTHRTRRPGSSTTGSVFT